MPNSSPSIHVYSDTSGSHCGAYCIQLGWFQLEWPPSWSEVSIAPKEMVPVVVAAAIWGKHWAGRDVRFHVDNLSVVAVIQRVSAWDDRLHHLVRCLMMFAALFRFHPSAQHIPGCENSAADALSRNMKLFFSFVQQTCQSAVPAPIVRLLVESTPNLGSPDWTRQFGHCLAAVLHHPPGPCIQQLFDDTPPSVARTT
jgi:hypothetical protein